MAPRILFASLILLSAAGADDEISVRSEDDALVVRSPISRANFLFRVAGGFEQTGAPEGYAVELTAPRKNGAGGADWARIRLRVATVGAPPAPRTAGQWARAEAGAGLDDPKAAKKDAEFSGRGARVRARLSGTEGSRKLERVLVALRDGSRIYLLFLDRRGDRYEAELEKVASGFTILDPKGVPAGEEAPPDAEALQPRTIEEDFYRLSVFKPEGFVRRTVVPAEDPGIVLHLRRYDDNRNLCDIRIRVWLKKTVKQSLEERARARIETFAGKYKDSKVPRRPRRTRWRGAEQALKAKLVGKQPRSGIVVTEEWRFIEHENDRVYEIQMTLAGDAERAWRKEIRKFWRRLRMEAQ